MSAAERSRRYNERHRVQRRAKALERYYAQHESNKDRQRNKHRETRRKLGWDPSERLREPGSLSERIATLARFNVREFRRREVERSMAELMEPHERWLEMIDLWRMAEAVERADLSSFS